MNENKLSAGTMEITEDHEPKLAPPGAGIPGVELLIARSLLKLLYYTERREKVSARFQTERERVRALADQFNPDEAARRVLVPRLRGMEDSSRYWSLLMTLDHLRIIHRSIIGVVTNLADGKIPPGQASTAAVKPSASVTSAVVPLYEESCDDLIDAIAKIPNLRTKARFTHPWFGSLDAAGWHLVSAIHLGIHRQQIQSILAILRNKAK